MFFIISFLKFLCLFLYWSLAYRIDAPSINLPFMQQKKNIFFSLHTILARSMFYEFLSMEHVRGFDLWSVFVYKHNSSSVDLYMEK